MRTSNHIERLNKELKRRSNVIGIFPNTESLIRLMGSVIIDIHDQWLSRLRRLFYRPALAEIEANEVMLKALAKEQRALLLAS